MEGSSNSSSSTCAARICEVGGGGLLLPLGGDAEQQWPNGLRVVLYLLGLGWCFVGVAIISDVFMSGIEKVTSKKKRVMDKRTGRLVTVSVWNETVSNLTLMALGSSAPEIMLSVIEILGNDMYTGDLGPSTIIGSAAFNLLCISGVCIMAIPDGEIRKIKELPVYIITASSSVAAYLWLLFILMGPSPNVVEIWEGLLTLLFFPILVVVAFLADRGYFSKSSPDGDNEPEAKVIYKEMEQDEIARIEHRIREEHGAHLTEDQVMRIMQAEYFGHQSRAYYRIAAVRAATGCKKLQLAGDNTKSMTVTSDTHTGDDISKESQMRTIEIGFCSSKYAVLESCGTVKLPLLRKGDVSKACSVKFRTLPGKAQPVQDYTHRDETITFAPNESEKQIVIEIVDDATHEDDEDFYVELYDPVCEPTCGAKVVLSESTKQAQVMIIDDDDPGMIRFAKELIVVPESTEDYEIQVKVERKNGGTGIIGCKYYTEPDTAVDKYDYIHAEGTIEFKPGEQEQFIPVTIKAVGRYENVEQFRMILVEPFTKSEGAGNAPHDTKRSGAKFDKDTDGGEDKCIAYIEIRPDDNHKAKLDKMMSNIGANWNKMSIGHANWKSQFLDALWPESDDADDGDEPEKPGISAWVVHIISLPWKLLFAIVPPTDYCDGWVCFGCSLVMIGIVTAIVGDMAGLLGCTMGVLDEITAITFVALGTSLPDTFASKAAAQMDPYADASIGNVTGSNSVNVFLGLGLPWLMAAIYWQSGKVDPDWVAKYADIGNIVQDFPDGAFAVPAGSLWFNLMVFSLNAGCAIGLLALRRKIHGGELGGPRQSKLISAGFMVFQWFIYIGLSSYWAVANQKSTC